MASYVSVTWTAGDVITEAKLDNMVANDQSEDAHAANGMIMNNNVAYKAKNSGGTANEVVKKDTNDDLQVGVNNTDGHTVVNAGTSKLVKVKVLRQNATSNVYENNSIILTGWSSIAGNGASNGSIAVTLGITFTAYPVVLVSFCGIYSSASVGDLTNYSYNNAGNAKVGTVTTSGFTCGYNHEDNSSGLGGNPSREAITWIVVGQLN